MTQPNDDQLVRLVRAGLAEDVASVDVRTPDWPDLERRLRDVRAGRRRRRVVLAAPAVAALAVAAVGVQIGVLGRRGNDGTGPATSPTPMITVSPTGSAHPAQPPRFLDDGRVRGSLRNDTAWLDAFRTRAARPPGSEAAASAAAVAKVHVVYAADVAEYRLALVVVPASRGGGRQAIWYQGPAGAAARVMQEATSNPFGGAAGRQSSTFTTQRSAGSSTAVIVALTTSDITYRVAGSPTYAADGSVRRPVRDLHPDADGVLQITLPLQGGASYLVGSATTDPRSWESITRLSEPSGPGTPADADFPLVHPVPKSELTESVLTQLARGIESLRSEGSLPMAQGAGLWVGQVGGWTTTVGAVTAPSGAHLVSVNLEAPEPGQNATVGTRLATVLPAGPLDRVALAWKVTTVPTRGGRQHVQGVGVLGPVGAERARTTTGDGRVLETELRAGGGLLTLTEADLKGRQVEFLGADGAVLARTPILADSFFLPAGV